VTTQLRRLLGEHTPTIYAWPIAAAATGLRYFGVAAVIFASVRTSTVQSRAAERVFALAFRQRLRMRITALRVPVMVTGLLLLILVFADHILPGMFLIHTFGTEVLIQYNALMNPSGAAVLALVPAVLSISVSFLIATTLRKRSWTFVRSDDEVDRPRNHWAWIVGFISIAIAVGVPMTGLFVRASAWSNLSSAWANSRPEVLHSFSLAIIGAVLTVGAALPLVRASLAAHHARRGAIAWTVLINLVVPASLLGLGMIMLFSLRPLQAVQDTEVPLFFGYVARFAPIVMITLFVSWLRISPMSDLAAKVHVPSLSARMISIVLPPRASALVLSFALAALLIAAELDISLILVRPGPTTLGIRLYTLIHTAPDALVSALAVDMLLLILGVVITCLILRALIVRALHRSVR
jgi:iron(III) transport system permease protein